MTTAAVDPLHLAAGRRSGSPDLVGLCLDCNYPLMALPPHRCPECGRAFDPADAETVNTGRPVPAYAAWAVGPISWPVYAVALVGCAVTLWRARLPMQPFSWHYPVLWGWAAVAGLWLAWPGIRRAVLGHYGWPRRVIEPMGRLHWAVPAAMLAMAAAAAAGVPPRVAFDLSRPDMDRLARAVAARPGDVVAPGRVGCFWAKNVTTIDGGRGVLFVVDDRDAHSRVGFARLPPGGDVSRLKLRFNLRQCHALGGGWWDWNQAW